MSRNFANTYFAAQLAIQKALIRELNEIDTERILTLSPGNETSFTIDNDPTADTYKLYIPLPGSYISSAGIPKTATRDVIYNPDAIAVEIRTADWFSSIPTPTISTNLYGPALGNFTSISSEITRSDTTINLYLFDNGGATKAWFLSV